MASPPAGLFYNGKGSVLTFLLPLDLVVFVSEDMWPAYLSPPFFLSRRFEINSELTVLLFRTQSFIADPPSRRIPRSGHFHDLFPFFSRVLFRDDRLLPDDVSPKQPP